MKERERERGRLKMGANSAHIKVHVYGCNLLTKESIKISNGSRF